MHRSCPMPARLDAAGGAGPEESKGGSSPTATGAELEVESNVTGLAREQRGPIGCLTESRASDERGRENKASRSP
jgi:hypothetical protein